MAKAILLEIARVARAKGPNNQEKLRHLRNVL
jgi:hypothetical protein